MKIKIIDRNRKINVIEKDISHEDSEKNNYFGNRPFRHICEVCQKEEVLRSAEAKRTGWDYPGEGAVFPPSMFGILSPRKCGKCSIKDTVFWAISVEMKEMSELSERQIRTLERILNEPEIYNIEGLKEDMHDEKN